MKALSLALLLFFCSTAYADCTTTTMGNQPAGHIFYNADNKVIQYCDGTDWIAMHTAGSGAGGCTNPTKAEGQMVFNNDYRVMQACAGNIWRAMGVVDGIDLDFAVLSTMGADLTGTSKWHGGVVGSDSKIYGIPLNSTDILIIDPVGGTATLRT